MLGKVSVYGSLRAVGRWLAPPGSSALLAHMPANELFAAIAAALVVRGVGLSYSHLLGSL